jgi:hypothetical protein
MANSFTGRQIIVNTTGSVGFGANMKVIDGWWQDITAAGQVLTFTDAAGRSFSFTSFSSGGTGFAPVPIGKLDWLEGPLNFTAVPSGNVYLILGNK